MVLSFVIFAIFFSLTVGCKLTLRFPEGYIKGPPAGGNGEADWLILAKGIRGFFISVE